MIDRNKRIKYDKFWTYLNPRSMIDAAREKSIRDVNKICKNNEKIFIKKEYSANRKASNPDLFMKSVHNEARRNNVGIVMDGRVAEGREGSEVE